MVTRRRSIAREWSTQEEIRLFSLLCDFKPVGKKKHENMVKILESLNSDESNPFLEDQVWQKLDKFYDLERLGEIEDEADEEPEEELDNSVKKDGLQEGKISDSVEEKEEQEARLPRARSRRWNRGYSAHALLLSVQSRN